MKRRLLVACLAVLASLVACHHTMSFTPEEIDQLHASCTPRFDADGGVPAVKSSDMAGHRLPVDPPGTPIVIYGASWCGACHMAAQYLTRRGIPFVDKDVEEDPSAKAASLAALQAAGLGAKHGLPVMDVRGTVMIGFFPCLVEQAWAAP